MKTRGTGTIFQPKFKDRKTKELRTSPTWWLRYSAYDPAIQARRTFRESANTENKSEAMKLLKKRIGDDAHGKPPAAKSRNVTFEDLHQLLITDYTVNNQRGLLRIEFAWKHLAETFAGMKAVDIIIPRIDAYVKARLATGARPATVQLELAALRRAFTLAVEKQVLPTMPKVKSLKISNARQGFFERDEYEAVLDQLSDDLKPVITFAYFTGWRIGEILALQWSHVDFKLGTVRLDPGTTKNLEGRTFPFAIEPELVAMLQAQRERVTIIEKATARVIPFVFVRSDKRYCGKPIENFRKAWDVACENAGLSHKLVHDFRRTAVRNMERAGVPRSVAMSLTGHRSEVVYRRYAITNVNDQALWVKKLAEQHAQDAQAASKVTRLRVAK